MHSDDADSHRRTNLTQLLEAGQGDDDAAASILPLVYQQLRAIARRQMSVEQPGHTLDPTALVHEAYLKISGGRTLPWRSRAHFFVAAAEAMRQVLLDHAKSRRRLKRGGGLRRLPMSIVDLADSNNPEEIVAFDDTFCRFESEAPEAAAVVRLRFYAGLSVEETASALDVSVRTVNRRWAFARAWLYRELAAG